MKKSFPILFLLLSVSVFQLFSISSQAADRITALVTVTNKTVNGDTFTVNGTTRTWTNTVFVPSTQVLTNYTGSSVKTNLTSQIGSYPFTSVTLVDNGTNSFKLIGASATALTISLSTAYATVSYSTQTVTTLKSVRVPISGEPTAGVQNEIASGIVDGLNDKATNAISATATVASNLVGVANSQTITGAKSFTGSLTASNAATIRATNLIAIGGVLQTQAGLGTSATNTWGFANNGLGLGLTWTRRTSSTLETYVFGNVFNSDGSFTWSGSMVVTGAVYASSLVLTNGGLIGDLSGGTNISAPQLVGIVPDLSLTNRTLTNFSAYAATYQSTNTYLANSDIAFTRNAVASLANGNNAAVPVGTNVFIEVSGPTGAFTINGINAANAQRDGKIIYIVNQTGQNMTIAHQSGTDPTAANRIITMTGADRTTTGNGAATLIYSASASRWLLISLEQ